MPESSRFTQQSVKPFEAGSLNPLGRPTDCASMKVERGANPQKDAAPHQWRGMVYPTLLFGARNTYPDYMGFGSLQILDL